MQFFLNIVAHGKMPLIYALFRLSMFVDFVKHQVCFENNFAHRQVTMY